MRIATLVTYPVLLGALIALPTRAPAQVSITLNARLGPAVGLTVYTPVQYGAWQSNYLQWTPVTLYVLNGQYYQRSVRGARPVQVYQRGNEHFLPPRDRAWVGHDKRFDNRHRPSNADYRRARRPR